MLVVCVRISFFKLSAFFELNLAPKLSSKLQKSNPDGIENYFKEHLPINRLGKAEDIGPAVTYLCSDQASFMAGSIIDVDGGGM